MLSQRIKWCYTTLFLLTIFTFTACHEGDALRVKQKEKIDINLLYLEDESAPKLSGADLESIIKQTKNDLKEYYNVNVGKVTITQSKIENVFNYKAYKVPSSLKYQNNIDRLLKVLSTKMNDMDLKQKLKFVPSEYVEYVRQHNEVPNEALKKICINALERNSKLLLTKQINVNLNENIFYYVFDFWLTKIKDLKDYDLVLFNGFLIENLDDFENGIMSMHVFTRGGISFGFTEKTKGKFNGSAVVGTMPILAELEPFQEWRGSTYTKDDKTKAIANVISHEFGHLLFDYRDEYDQEGCIMNPVTDYLFKETSLKIGKCNIEPQRLGYIDAIFGK